MINLNKYQTWIKVISGTIGIAVSAYGGYKGVERIMLNKFEKDKLEEMRWNKVDMLLQSDSARFIQYNQLIRKVTVIDSNQRVQGKVMRNLRDYMEDKAATKEDLKAVYDVFEGVKKKWIQ